MDEGSCDKSLSRQKGAVSCNGSAAGEGEDPFAYFREDTARCLEFAKAAKEEGRKIIGIYCEFTPRELIMAAGAVPICLCGGSQSTISAAEEDLPNNLCPLIKSSYGYIKQGSCPFFEMAEAVVAETTCDGKKKMYELLSDRKKLHILELPQKPDQEQAYRHWLTEVKQLRAFLEEICGTEISDAKLRQSIGLLNRDRSLRQKVYAYGAYNPPYLRGTEASLLSGRIAGLPSDEGAYEQLLGALEKRRRDGQATAGGEAVRVLVTGVPMVTGAEKLLEIIEQVGGAVVAQENCTGIKAVAEAVAEDGDPIEAIARRYFALACSCMTPNNRRLELLEELIELYKPQVVIDLVWQACHTYNVESFLIRKHLAGRDGLSYLKIETDYSPSDREQIAIRVQAVLEVARSGGSDVGYG